MAKRKPRIGMTCGEYAERAGVTRQAIYRARDTGRLSLFPDGSIDPEASDRRRAETTDPAMQRGRHAPVAATTPPAGDEHRPPTAGQNFAEARAANEVMKAQLRRIDLAKKKGELVDRARATALVFRLARQERDAWVGWPARVAAIMAAEVGIGAHTMQTILERHVREHLEQLAEVRPEFH